MPDTSLPSTFSFDLVFSPPDNARLASLCGPYDNNLKQIEQHFGVTVRVRENSLRISGEETAARAATQVLEQLYAEAARGPVSGQSVQLQLQETAASLEDAAQEKTKDLSEIQIRRGSIRGRGATQTKYIRNIRSHDINFGIGPAGTGKTFLAVACAAEALQRDQVRRLVLVRPAVEAGERLGFLPGDLAQKIDPYLRPLYDALYDIVGFDQVAKLMERNVIELAPLAYMRGRTLNDSFIILDEAQNTTVEQMKMFLTRIGFNSTVVITGDITQVDLPRGAASGLVQVIDILKGIEGISFTFFDARDVVRHPLIQRIVAAYDRHEGGTKKDERR